MTIFTFNYNDIVIKISRTTLVNVGHEFSVQDYRVKRLRISDRFEQALRETLAKEHIRLFEVYLHEIKFSSRINKVNELRLLNDIYNEKAVAEKAL